ncbi:stage V sporulation protein AE [Paraliobacillus sediminis]|uniref:stage V sporulation protein AE n=1 Tax=Paraliobacillus sediminis TaxID=1885916 RepID=UPI000E3E3F17|nr:stage V sporulation protein AE [Paraliobacillus sediminis]
MNTKQVIIITDGDQYAQQAIDYIAKTLGGTSLSEFAGNPSAYKPRDIIQAVYQAKKNPVFVLVDDAGVFGIGSGEETILALANDPIITILGVVAVAAHSKNMEWSRVTLSIDQEGQIIEHGVDKEGVPVSEVGRINGDTVYILDQMDLPNVIAIGDIGKMHGYDDKSKGYPITLKAIELILERGVTIE